jgi:hypothetical protein
MGTLEEIRSSGTLRVLPWHDAPVEALGHDPRSCYVERFWLPLLGPSTVFLLRLLATALDAAPEGCELGLAETARRLGLGERSGRNAPVVRTLARCVDFEMARPAGSRTLAVRRRMPPLADRQLGRLGTPLLDEHARWVEAGGALGPLDGSGASSGEWDAPWAGGPPVGAPPPEAPGVAALRERGRRLALSLLRLGEDREATERQLVRWRYHPALARECSTWAAAHQGGEAAAELKATL